MVVVPDGLFYHFRRDVVALVDEAKLPAIYPEREYADDGGLMAYGTNSRCLGHVPIMSGPPPNSGRQIKRRDPTVWTINGHTPFAVQRH
jgi:hypothetical protein